jgi:hypothetical protein
MKHLVKLSNIFDNFNYNSIKLIIYKLKENKWIATKQTIIKNNEIYNTLFIRLMID